MSRKAAAAIPANAVRSAPTAPARRLVDALLSPRYGGLAVLVLAVLVTPQLIDGLYQYDLAILVCINATVVLALNLLVGYARQISLGHAGFFGLGGYGSAILATRYEWPALLCVLVAVVAVGLLAYVVARPVLRLKGYYLAMATLGLGMIIYLVINSETWLTGGPDGLSVAPMTVFGHMVFAETTWYWIVAALLVLMYLVALNLIESPVGRALRAVHGSEIAAQSVGVDVTWYKVLVFVISAVVAALMGALHAFYSGFISPGNADFMHSIEMVVMVVLGGMGSLVGALVGAVGLTLLPQLLTVVEEYEGLAYGLVLMLVMIFMPRGLVPTLYDRLRRMLP